MDWTNIKQSGWFRSDINDVPDDPGNYAIYVTDGYGKISLMYIGTASNLYKRIKTQPIIKVLQPLADTMCYWFDSVYIKYCIEHDEENRKRREFNLINRTSPIINKQGL